MSLSLRVTSPLLVVTIKTVINIINIRKIGKGGYFSPVITLMAFSRPRRQDIIAPL